MNLNEIKLSTTQASELVGMKNESLKTWLKRYTELGGDEIEGGGSHGKSYTFNFKSLMELAIAWKLVDEAGVPISQAVNAGATFAYTYNYSYNAIEARDIGSDAPQIVRHPACPYFKSDQPDLNTLAFVSSKGCSVVAWGEGHDPLKAIASLQGGLSTGSFIECRSVFNDMCHKLGFNPIAEIEKLNS